MYYIVLFKFYQRCIWDKDIIKDNNYPIFITIYHHILGWSAFLYNKLTFSKIYSKSQCVWDVLHDEVKGNDGPKEETLEVMRSKQAGSVSSTAKRKRRWTRRKRWGRGKRGRRVGGKGGGKGQGKEKSKKKEEEEGRKRRRGRRRKKWKRRERRSLYTMALLDLAMERRRICFSHFQGIISPHQVNVRCCNTRSFTSVRRTLLQSAVVYVHDSLTYAWLCNQDCLTCTYMCSQNTLTCRRDQQITPDVKK